MQTCSAVDFGVEVSKMFRSANPAALLMVALKRNRNSGVPLATSPTSVRTCLFMLNVVLLKGPHCPVTVAAIAASD